MTRKKGILFSFLPGAYCVFFLLSACYSAEFQPSDDYANYRKADVDDVVILNKRPGRPIKVLGTLIVRDFSGDTDDPGFTALLRRQARQRGAEGAWITERRLHKQSIGTYSSAPSTDRRSSASHQPALTGSIETELGVVTVTLFVFAPPRPQ